MLVAQFCVILAICQCLVLVNFHGNVVEINVSFIFILAHYKKAVFATDYLIRYDSHRSARSGTQRGDFTCELNLKNKFEWNFTSRNPVGCASTS